MHAAPGLTRIAILVLLSGFLIGADGCPLQPSESSSGGGIGARVDLGGAEGALWEVTVEDRLLLTLRQGDEVLSKQTDDRRAPLLLLGETIDIASFCWRPDIACPQHVLGSQILVAQPDSSATVLLTFNRRGPLSAVHTTGLAGRLDGRELSVALPTADARTTNVCSLLPPSAILATASKPDDGEDQRADQIEGRITVTYDGMCLATGGSAALAPGASLELSAGFSARRR